MLREGPTFAINGSFGSPQKSFSVNFTNVHAKFCMNLHYNIDNSYLLVNRREIFKFTADNFVSDAYLMDLVILTLEKYYYIEM